MKKVLVYVATTLLIFYAALSAYGDQVQVVRGNTTQAASSAYVAAVQEIMNVIGPVGGDGATQSLVLSDTQLKKLEDQFYVFVDQKNMAGARAALAIARAYQTPSEKITELTGLFLKRFDMSAVGE